MTKAKDIAKYLDEELKVAEIEDHSNNGLQVQNSDNTEIKKVAFAVDANVETFEKAAQAGCQMLIVHHGLIWDGIKSVTGLDYSRVKFLIENDLALYGVHLPLDAHPKYGNNSQLAKLLSLKNLKEFGKYHGTAIGFIGQFSGTLADVKKILENNDINTKCWEFGKKDNEQIKTIGIVSGGGMMSIKEASEIAADLLLTGDDSSYSAYSWAKELQLTVIIGGHYKTEVWGVKALMPIIKEKFNVGVEFIDVPTPI
ncbi:MAG: Nif3-like dinuclear metal center hexameric protein [archaeon]|nr:Nif3-like dinuclear metal center hexameric protein [Nanoarchaeota archaeon]